MNLKEIEDHKFDDLKLKLEKEIENLQKYVKPAELSIEELEKVVPLDVKKIEGFMAEIKLLESEIKERQDKIDLIDVEVKHRMDIRLLIENALKDFVVDEDVLESFVLHDFEFCDHIEIKEENEEGIEVVKEIKHIPWDKEAVLKDLKLKLDLDKANDLVRRVKDYKHNKKKGEIENRLKPLIVNNVYFNQVFGPQIELIKGQKHEIPHKHWIEKNWDKDDLIDFEAKVLKLEEAKVKLDDIEKKEKPIKDRQREYSKIDGLLFEALVEKLEEGRPEKMDKYLELRKDIKHRHPIEE